ncbi:MAG: hypothetical protein J1E85_09605 [Ruminococcus sp.]|nr:hypothetical protein [Ruminococcus sp.]
MNSIETKTNKKRGIIKKVTAVTMCAMMAVSCFGITASAANKEFDFEVRTTVNGGKQFSSTSKKDDNEQRAYVTTKHSNLISSDLFYYSVWKGNTKVTPYSRTTTNGSKTISYYSGKGKAGSYYKLQGDTDKYYVTASGVWCP